MGNPTGFRLTPGQTHDLAGTDILLEETLAAGVIADKAYDVQARPIEPLQSKGKSVVIPLHSNHKEPHSDDKHLYKARHLIENFFARLKQY